MSQLSYAAAGVSIDAGDELVERIKPAAKRTLIPGVLGSIGGFGALFEAHARLSTWPSRHCRSGPRSNERK